MTMNKTENNLFANIPDDLSAEIFEDILDAKSNNGTVRIERIISNGQTSPEQGWYDQEQNEWVIVIKGRAQLTFETDFTCSTEHSKPKVVDLNVGDYINIPIHTKHKVSYTDTDQPTIWLAIFY